MTLQERALTRLRERFADATFEVSEFRGATTVFVPRERLAEVCVFLRDDDDLRFDFLSDLCAVDLLATNQQCQERFEVVYHLYSLSTYNFLTLKVRVPEDDARVSTVTGVWSTANWHERETFDLMGIAFDGHPDLRRILTAEQVYDERVQQWKPFAGHPLRRDFDLDYQPVDFTVQEIDRSLRPTN